MFKNDMYVKFELIDIEVHNYRIISILKGYIIRKELINLKNLIKILNEKKNELYEKNEEFHEHLNYSELAPIIEKSNVLKKVFEIERKKWLDDGEDSSCPFTKLDIVRPTEFFKN